MDKSCLGYITARMMSLGLGNEDEHHSHRSQTTQNCGTAMLTIGDLTFFISCMNDVVAGVYNRRAVSRTHWTTLNCWRSPTSCV